MDSQRTKLINSLDEIILSSLYAVAFFFPISKAIIEIFSTLAIVCYIVKKIILRQKPPAASINLAILVFLFVCFVSILTSSNFKISSRIFFGKTLQDILFFFVLADTLSSERKLRNFLYVLFLSSAVLGTDGIYQYFTHKDFIRGRPTIFINRIYATFPSPNDFGCYLITVIPFLVTIFFAKFRFKAVRFLLVGLFFLLFTCLILTVSRGAWYAFAVSILFLGVWVYPIGLLFLLICLFITVTQPFFPALIKERLSSLFLGFDASILSDEGSIERRIFWMTGWKMFMSRPWTGLGLGTFMSNFKNFVVETYQYGPSYAHNCYLQMLAELGIIGLLSFLSILILFFCNGIRIIRERAKSFSWYILLGSMAAVLGYSVQMAVETIFYSLDLGMLFWMLLGLGVAAMNSLKLESKPA